MLSFTLVAGVVLGHFAFLFHMTDFVAEYGKLMGISKCLWLPEYESWQEKRGFLGNGYPVFIREKFPNFAGKLIGCAFCIITFLSCLWCLRFGWLFLYWGLFTAAVGSVVFMVEKALYDLVNKNFHK